MMLMNIPKVKKLSTPEKILFLEELWDSISGEEDAIAVPESHIRELERRRNLHEAGMGRVLTLEELRSSVHKKIVKVR